MRSKTLTALVCVALATAIGVVVPTASAAATGDFRPIAGEDGIPDAFIVVLKAPDQEDEQDDPDAPLTDQDLLDKAERAQVDKTVAELLSRYQGKLEFTYYDVFRGFAVRMPPAVAEELAAEPIVEFVEQQTWLYYTDEQIDPPWNLDLLDDGDRDMSYRYGTTGAEVHAYIIDSGIRSTHQEFGGRVVERQAFIPRGHSTGGVADCFGHGTAMASIVGGNMYGVAKQVHLHDIRIGGCDDGGTSATFAAAADWLMSNVRRPAVANLSATTGDTRRMESIDRSALRLMRRNVTLVTSAGNLSRDACRTSPARVPRAITVGAWEPHRLRMPGTGWGPCLDIFAPGIAIQAAGNANDGEMVLSYETSPATAHVTGAIARFLEQHPGTPPWLMIDVLQDDARADMLTNPHGSPNFVLRVIESGPGNDGFGGHTGSDLDGDGRDDIVAFARGRSPGVVAALSTGSSFGPEQAWYPRAEPNELQMLGDFDGDGMDDMVTFTRGSHAHVYVARSDGTQFVGGGGWWHTWFAPGHETPAVGDFDGDGRDDIVAFTRGSSADAYVALSNGDEFVSTGERWSNDVAGGTAVPLIGDFTCDGRDDVLAVERTWDWGTRPPTLVTRAVVSPSTGTRFAAQREWRDHWPISGIFNVGTKGLRTPLVGDFDGDGCSDLALVNRDNDDVEVLLSTGSKFRSPAWWHGDVSTTEGVPGVGDFDGDGRDDIVAFVRGHGGPASVTLSTGTGFDPMTQWRWLFVAPYAFPQPAVMWP